MRILALSLVLGVQLSAAACIDTLETGAPELNPSPPGDVDVTSRWVGEWSSPSCGNREFERRIKLREDGEFRGEDRVAPCPMGAQCMWSGLVLWSGTWEANSQRALLHEIDPPPGPIDAPRPRALHWIENADAPAELTPEGGRCLYKKETSAPPLEPLGLLIPR